MPRKQNNSQGTSKTFFRTWSLCKIFKTYTFFFIGNCNIGNNFTIGNFWTKMGNRLIDYKCKRISSKKMRFTGILLFDTYTKKRE